MTILARIADVTKLSTLQEYTNNALPSLRISFALLIFK